MTIKAKCVWYYVDKFGSWRTVTGSIHDAGRLLSFESPVLLFPTPIANLLLCGWILSTTGKFTHSIKGRSSTVSCSGCYGLWPSLVQSFTLCMWSSSYNFTHAVSIKCKLIFNFFCACASPGEGCWSSMTTCTAQCVVMVITKTLPSGWCIKDTLQNYKNTVHALKQLIILR